MVLMGVDNRAAIATCLINGGRPARDPVAFLQYASTERECVIESTLEQVARGEVDVAPPAVFVIGEVVRLRTALGRGLKTRAQDTILPHIGVESLNRAQRCKPLWPASTVIRRALRLRLCPDAWLSGVLRGAWRVRRRA